MLGATMVQWNHACFGVRGVSQVYGFESCPRYECRLDFLTRGSGFQAGAAMVQWNHAYFGVRGVSKCMGSNPVHGLSLVDRQIIMVKVTVEYW
ncbi:hypothetical protein E2C01_041991 [Portunus trituberculatus]|uniref:Uncharacterized protein n=1 Tax=Portunus trituberculatus TaxID=210409 RepID=A0A5B7FNZ4_PORTR|nr:hypothetical protein [Portunus trituberculatus]